MKIIHCGAFIVIMGINFLGIEAAGSATSQSRQSSERGRSTGAAATVTIPQLPQEVPIDTPVRRDQQLTPQAQIAVHQYNNQFDFLNMQNYNSQPGTLSQWKNTLIGWKNAIGDWLIYPNRRLQIAAQRLAGGTLGFVGAHALMRDTSAEAVANVDPKLAACAIALAAIGAVAGPTVFSSGWSMGRWMWRFGTGYNADKNKAAQDERDLLYIENGLHQQNLQGQSLILLSPQARNNFIDNKNQIVAVAQRLGSEEFVTLLRNYFHEYEQTGDRDIAGYQNVLAMLRALKSANRTVREGLR